MPHEATVQFGIGSIPNALCEALVHHRDLGVHTEMINDSIMTLVAKGIVTGKVGCCLVSLSFLGTLSMLACRPRRLRLSLSFFVCAGVQGAIQLH